MSFLLLDIPYCSNLTRCAGSIVLDFHSFVKLIGITWPAMSTEQILLKRQYRLFNFILQFSSRRQIAKDNLSIGSSRLNFDISEAKDSA